EKQVLGFFGPAWLINYTMLDNCGNKPEGLGSAGDCVASGTVMAKSTCTPDFLAKQNMFDVFVPANAFANGKNLTQYDEKINTIFRDKVREYTAGNLSKEEAIDAFKTDVNEQLGIAID
ncbi:MAG: carbohydrate ABC transporter substrate-binding protein, partial [Lachnospiraceae bacterium]|nr:carbohydrate ABC transporter substrate-binding protein [Lachnospiraceae bacterium]